MSNSADTTPSSSIQEEVVHAQAGSQTRSAAKWIISTLAATAGVIFGVGPIVSRPTLSWQHDSLQLIVAIILGAASLIGIVVLILKVAAILMPVRVTLSSLPSVLIAELDGSAGTRLPNDANSFNNFVENLKKHELRAVNMSADVRRTERKLRSLPRGDARTLLEKRLAVLEPEAATAIANREVYWETTRRLLRDATFIQLRKLYEDRSKSICFFALLAALGGLGFQLSLAADNKEPVGQVAYVTPILSDIGQKIWSGLQFDRCRLPSGEVPVILEGGSGSSIDPYRFTTMEVVNGCPTESISLSSDQILMRHPERNTIKIELTK
ncbi:hypothetical protein ACTXG6_06565 [Pseudonocardia sp. Cha107L01]|uniref:hypothetical protein n=1 Tax=Pseudonocardia sp. Cha107L01 TaxID=3457576 RepID=UPI00403EDA55